MKPLIIVFLLLVSLSVAAQDVDYKKGMITVDGNDYAKIEVKKTNFGLTKTFEVFNMAGDKVLIAVPATEYEQGQI